MRAIIVDDMTDAIELLREDIHNTCPTVNVVDTASNISDAVDKITAQLPDLVFLDIQLNPGTGFDLLDRLDDQPIQVIFTTASNAYAIKAFRYAAIDYLLKPIDHIQLREAVTRAQQMMLQSEQLQVASKAYKNEGASDILMLHTTDEIKRVKIDNIIRCQSHDNYTMFYFDTGKKVLISKTLKFYDQLLSAHGFLRVHQSHLINPKYLEAYKRKEGGYLTMSDKSQIPVSVRKRSKVLNFLSQ